MKISMSFALALSVLLSVWIPPDAIAQTANADAFSPQGPGFTSDVLDPVVELQLARQRREQAKAPGISLFATSPLTPIRERGIEFEKRLYDLTDIKFATNFNHLLQGLSDEIPGEDDYGMSTFMTFVATWDGWRKGRPNQGELTIGLDGRWNWGTIDPTTLGARGLGSAGLTANPFTTYTPTFLVRNLFWRQGGQEAGWAYRIGRVTPDQFLSSSRHITPLTTFLPASGTGAFSMGLADSGLGMMAGLRLNDRANVTGVVSDANADRTNFGKLDEGDLFTAVELQVKILPLTKQAGYSKVTFWHNDGTRNGTAINGSTGREGWGAFIKYEQELTHDGRIIGIGRWGKCSNRSAAWKEQAAAHLLVYDPFSSGRFSKMGFNADLAGVAYNWLLPSNVDRGESNVETFYRFPLFPEVDASLSYQAIINPALDPDNDYGSAFSLRLRSTW
ncbi:MAG: hypothetical protein ACR2NZ_13100 [Rubripirellula sp.]